jgi:hypothetical protein
MSDDLRLPDELAAFEALLAAQALPAVGINRDQLMYRAGWAAREAEQHTRPLKGEARFDAPEAPAVTRRDPPAEPGAGRERRRAAAWSVVSAAVAASLAVVGTLAWESSGGIGETERAGGETPRLADVDALPPELMVVEHSSDYDVAVADVERLLDSHDEQDRITLAGPWFAMKRRGFERTPNDAANPSERVTAATDEALPSAKTASELWKELNPSKTATPTPVWPWGRPHSGDSI